MPNDLGGQTMKTLVVGGAGYIGSIVASELVEAGHEVSVLDDLTRGTAQVEGTTFYEASLLDPESLNGALSNGFDVVLHFAALALVPESVAEPELYFRVNVGGTLNLLEAMNTHDIKRIVFSSTCAVYGEPASVPITEQFPNNPTNSYGASKLAVDHLLTAWTTARNSSAVSLRYFNVAGAAHGLGEHHEPETHIIPIVLDAAAGTRPHVEIFGTDYPTPDGTAVRDYIHVLDLATAHILAIEATSTPGRRIYNLGNGAGFSVREVIETAERVTGRSIAVVESERRAGDPAQLISASDLIRSELGWVPRYPELERMIADAWEHRGH
jgi:UDP-glucose 4-epimerase